MKTFDHKITEVWNKRYGGQLVSATETFLEVVSALGLSLSWDIETQSVFLLTKTEEISKEVIIDLLLFIPSKLRHEQRLVAAIEQTQQIEAVCVRWNMPLHFQLLAQRGLNYLANGDFGLALNDFILAANRGRIEYEVLIATGNKILVMESLGYDFSKDLVKFQTAIARAQPTAGDEVTLLRGINQQLIALQMRLAFSFADIKKISLLAEEIDATRQAGAFALQLDELGYLESFLTQERRCELVSELQSSANAYLTQFRLSTLHRVVLRNDFEASIRLDDKIERLYFWVWHWLVCPSLDDLQRIMLWWEHLVVAMDGKDVGSDQLPMLRNSLRWLGMFADYDDKLMTTLIAQFGSVHKVSNQVLDFESHILDLLTSIHHNYDQPLVDDELKCLKSHSLAHASDFLLARAIQDVFSPSNVTRDADGDHQKYAAIKNLMQSIVAPFAGRVEPIEFPAITVEPRKRELKIYRSGKLPKSFRRDALFNLIVMTRNRQTVPIQEVLYRCFGLRAYDPTVHDVKLSHVVSHANKEFAGVLSFSRRRDQIFIERLDENLKIFDLGPTTGILQMAEMRDRFMRTLMKNRSSDVFATQSTVIAPNRIKNLNINRQPKEAPSASVDLSQKWFRREELQTILSASRATVCRRLSEWSERGLVDKVGVGRSTKYRLKHKLDTQEMVKGSHQRGVI